MHGIRVRPRLRHWHSEQHVWDAITSAHFPGRPAGRNLVYTVSGYPVPQAAVTRDHGWEDFRTVVVNLRPLNCDIEVVDVPAGITGQSVVGMLGPECSPQRLVQALQQGRLTCNCNGLPHPAALQLPSDTDVLALLPEGSFDGVGHAFFWQTYWDAVNHPAINMHETLPLSGAAALPRHTQVYLSIDGTFGTRYRAKQASWSAERCCQDAVVSATYMPQARGRVLVSNLHRLPQPQVVVFPAATTNLHRTVVFDLLSWGADPVAVVVEPGLPWRSALQHIPEHALPAGFSLALTQSAIALQVDGRHTHLDSLVLGLTDVVVPEAIRRALLDALPSDDTHQGGMPGSLLQAGQHIVRAYAGCARAQGLSHAALFFDVSSAYYRVIRQAFCELGTTDRALLAILHRLKVPDEYVKELLGWVQGAKLLRDVSPHLRALISQMMQATHFQTDGGTCIHETYAGVRPGDAIADVLYSFLQADFLRALRAATDEHQLTFQDALFGSSLAGRLLVPTWADDCVALLSARQPALLLQRLETIAALAHGLMHARGMAPNYTQGKTEAMIQFLGIGALQARRLLHVGQNGRLSFQAAEGVITCHCVPTYSHLGGRVHYQGGVLTDILQSAASALAALRPLSRSGLRNPALPFGRRRQTLRSLGFSRLLFSSPSWGPLNLFEQEAWRKSWTKIARLLFPDDRWTHQPVLPGTPEVCAAKSRASSAFRAAC